MEVSGAVNQVKGAFLPPPASPNNFTHLVIHLHFEFRCAPLSRFSRTYVTWLHLCGGLKTHLSVSPFPSLTLQSAHLVQAAHFLRRVDDLPTAGTLRVHPPNLRGAPTATVHSLPRGVVNVVRTESPTSPRWAALQLATPWTEVKEAECVRETPSVLPHSAAHRPVWGLLMMLRRDPPLHRLQASSS